MSAIRIDAIEVDVRPSDCIPDNQLGTSQNYTKTYFLSSDRDFAAFRPFFGAMPYKIRRDKIASYKSLMLDLYANRFPQFQGRGANFDSTCDYFINQEVDPVVEISVRAKSTPDDDRNFMKFNDGREPNAKAFKALLYEGLSRIIITNDGTEYGVYPVVVGGGLSLPVSSNLIPIQQLDSVSFAVKQKITYGAPGTGKSHKTKLETDAWKKNVFRTTFHPDSDYSTFVGAYKPTMSENAGRVEVYKGSGSSKVLDATQEVKQGISYEFVAQAFVKAYVLAWQKMAGAGDENGKPKPEPVFLVIEEINRGNCAQIFGDLFQLLDRNDAGYSEYPVDADADLRKFLGQKKAAAGAEAKGLGDIDANALATRYGIEADLATAIVEGRNLVLPPNLLIRATMNTSDQSLFPIDSAFKRRWDWKYVPISEPEVAKKRKIVCAWGEGEAHVVKRFGWWAFLDQFINKEIFETTKSEDKQLGYFFVKASDETGEITASKFASKVLFYLYNDVFKDYNYPASVFERKGGTKEKFKFRDFFDAKGKVKDEVVAEFLENLGLVADVTEDGGEAEGVASSVEPA